MFRYLVFLIWPSYDRRMPICIVIIVVVVIIVVYSIQRGVEVIA